MKILMLEVYQGNHEGQTMPVLQEGKEYSEKDIPESLIAWLIFVGKAKSIEEKHYGSQPLTEKPELRQDDVLSAEVKEVVEIPEEPALEPEPKKRGRKGGSQ